MPTHYGGGKGKSKKPAPKGTHRMPDGSLMKGEKHGDKPKAKAKPKAKGTGKGSKAMREKMAKMRAMKKK